MIRINLFPARCLLFAVCSLLFAISLGCQSTDPPTPPRGNSEGPDQVGWNSSITVTNNGRLTALVKYHRMEKFSKKRRVLFQDSVEVDFYNQHGQHSSRLTAERGVMNEENNDVVALGNVIVISDSGITLRSDSLRWDNRGQRVVTEAFVTITKASGETLQGYGFESDPNLKLWSIKRASGLTPQKVHLPSVAREPEAGMPAARPDSLD